MNTQTYTGSCHCGAVAFRADIALESVMACNCSHCSRKGFLLTFIPKSAFTLLRGEDSFTEYRFNKKHIAHMFCTTCGVEAFAFGTDQDGNETVAVNARCLDDVDLGSLKVTEVNGKDF